MSWFNKTHCSAKSGLSLFCRSVMISAALEYNFSEGVDEAVVQKKHLSLSLTSREISINYFYKMQGDKIFPIPL